MTAALIAARVIVSLMVAVCVGLAFLPHVTAQRLAALQIFLTEMIEARSRPTDRGQG